MAHVSFLYCLRPLCQLPDLIPVTSSFLYHKSIGFAHGILKLLIKPSIYIQKALIFTTVRKKTWEYHPRRKTS